ncbi:MAG TPA: serine/threonine-protein kinase, partial [Chthoniobacterales bacterium]
VEALLRADQGEKGLLEDIASSMAAGWVAETDSKSHHDLVGRNLGRYKVLAPLGSGGMGEVYLAQDNTLDRKAAIKLLPRHFTRDLDRLRRFEREARAASALNHPNIITIYEIGDWDGGRFIATEYVEGVTLRERLAKSRLTLAEVLDIGLQASSALAAAHQAGILHRDIKPANVMLRTDGYLKVLDFGLAKLIGPHAAGDVTETGRVMGTINYMSPEQAMGQPLDPRTDVFSLGVVLYEIATGHRLFAGKTEGATYDRILHQEVPPMQQFVPGLPPELDQVIRRAVEKDRANRYQTAGEFRADLKRLAEGESTEAASRERAKRRSHRWRIAAAAVVVLALIGALLFFSRTYLAHNEAVGPGGIPRKSIAVLPFENLSEDKTNTYFADGIQDEILTRLSKIADLRVISRTSTDHYKSAPNNLSEIGRQLGVANILEGSVQKSGNAVRVNVQLIKVADDSHLWAETFDRKTNRHFFRREQHRESDRGEVTSENHRPRGAGDRR